MRKYIKLKKKELRECKNKDGSTNIVYCLTFKKGDIELQVNTKDVTDTGEANLKDIERQTRKKAKKWYKDNELTNKEVSELIDRDGEVITKD